MIQYPIARQAYVSVSFVERNSHVIDNPKPKLFFAV